MTTKEHCNVHGVVCKGLVMAGVFVMATSARGEWVLFLVCVGRDYVINFVQPDRNALNYSVIHSTTLGRLGLHGLYRYVLISVGLAFLTFWGIGLSLDIYFYNNRKQKAAEWKCQPDRWLTKSNEWHEFLLGSFNMFIASSVCGVAACHVANGGWHTLYTDISEYGWTYFVVTIPVFFVYVEGANYYTHRIFHIPWLYRTFHKMHHRYLSPTLYSTTAMHPLESLVFQSTLIVPMFVWPLHAGVYVAIVAYFYYYGMLEHSGVKMESWWPWQPSTIFHDDHHRYFHCNFGVNVLWFDQLHGTLRRKDRTYGEKIFGGYGKLDGDKSSNRTLKYCEY